MFNFRNQPGQNMNMKQLYNQCMTNPMAAISSMNPMLAQMLQMGNNPEQLVRMICQQRGIDPNEFIKDLKSKIG